MKPTPKILRPPFFLAACAGLTLLAPVSSAAPGNPAGEGDWPWWRGPDRTGISHEAGWSPEGEAESVFEVDVGLGYSSVAVVDGRLYTKGFDEERGQDFIYCLDAKTGDRIWAYSYPAKIWDQAHGGGTLSTPSVEGEFVYVLNREGNFHRLDAATGKVSWARNMVAELEVKPPTWGFSASPLILEDMIILNLGSVVALDKESGEVLWKTENSGHAYANPAPFKRGRQTHLAVINGDGLVVLEADTGERTHFQAWETKYDINASTPIVHDNKVFISSGYGHGCALVDISGDKAEIVWENKEMRTKMTGCVLYENHLYGFDESMFKCINMHGTEMWRQRGLGMGAFMIANGKLLIASEDGELIIADASSSKFHELYRQKLIGGGVFWTPPVLANGMIYFRSSNGDLVCRDHRGAR